MPMVRSGRVGADRNGGNRRRTTTYATKKTTMASVEAARLAPLPGTDEVERGEPPGRNPER